MAPTSETHGFDLVLTASDEGFSLEPRWKFRCDPFNETSTSVSYDRLDVKEGTEVTQEIGGVLQRNFGVEMVSFA